MLVVETSKQVVVVVVARAAIKLFQTTLKRYILAIDGPNRGDFRTKLRRRRKDRLFQTKEAELEMKDEHETKQNKTC